MELTVQNFLRNGGTLDDLARKYAIKARRHQDFPNLICLKYNQIESDFSEEIVRDCRGIILDEAKNWDIACLTFRKFFNGGDPLAHPIDWNTAWVEEKVDGSLMQLYYYGGAWRVGSSGTPDASGNVVASQIEVPQTYADLFWQTWGRVGYDISMLNPDRCYAFELMTPFNRVVVPHPTSRLVLLGVRDRRTLQEYPTSEYETVYETVRTFPLQSWDDCMEAAKHVDPSCQEGYVVVVDGHWNRIKLKAPAYVALAHMKDGAVSSAKRVLEVIRKGESTEFLTYFPEWQPIFDGHRARFEELVAECETAYERIRNIPIQKLFALEAEKHRWPSILYSMRRGRSAREFLATVHIKHLMEALKIKDISYDDAA